MKKSRSSVPRFPERWPLGPAPPVKKEGLFATAGRPEPELPPPPVGPRVAMAVGKTKEGESLPAKPGASCYYEWCHVLAEYLIPSFEYPVPLQASVSTQSQCKGPQAARSLLVHDNGGGLRRHLCGWVRYARKLRLLEGSPLAMVRMRKGGGGAWVVYASSE